jgi:hypothetical protein
MKLYYHKTDGGAEYLTDKYVICPNGEKEGIFEGAKYIVRIDVNIKKDAELSVANEKNSVLKAKLKKRGVQIADLKHRIKELTNKYNSLYGLACEYINPIEVNQYLDTNK